MSSYHANKIKRGYIYSFIINVILIILVIFLIAKYIENTKDILFLKSTYLDQVFLDIATSHVLDALIVSGYLKNKISSINGSCLYRYVYNYETQGWELYTNFTVGFEDIKDFLERMYPSQHFYVLKIYNPENLEKVDVAIKVGLIDKENVVVDSSSIYSAVASSKQDLEIDDPIYASLNFFYRSNDLDTLFFSEDVMAIAENLDNSTFNYIQENVKNYKHYLLVIFPSEVKKLSELDNEFDFNCENVSLKQYIELYKEKFFLYGNYTLCKPIRNIQEVVAYGPTLDNEYKLIYYLPKYKTLLLNLPLNLSDTKLDLYIFSLVFERFFSKYVRVRYTQFFPVTIYGEISAKNLNAIGEKEYEHYYTRDEIEKVVIEYLQPKS